MTSMKQTGCKRCGKCLCAITAVAVALILVLSASILSPALTVTSGTPFHAECELTWKWSKTNCSTVKEALLGIAKKWKGSDNCDGGGEKCLYAIKAISDNEIELTHTTPKRKFVDDISFKFCGNIAECGKAMNGIQRMKRAVKLFTKVRVDAQDVVGCQVSGFSTSEVWYAVLDYGTNYCNMRNLAVGSGLTSKADFSEDVSDSICTQYSSSDCNKY